jgi:hypothetical protein
VLGPIEISRIMFLEEHGYKLVCDKLVSDHGYNTWPTSAHE